MPHVQQNQCSTMSIITTQKMAVFTVYLRVDAPHGAA